MLCAKDVAYTFSRPIAAVPTSMNRHKEVVLLVLAILTVTVILITVLPEAKKLRDRIKIACNKVTEFFHDPTHATLMSAVILLFYSTLAYKLRKDELLESDKGYQIHQNQNQIISKNAVLRGKWQHLDNNFNFSKGKIVVQGGRTYEVPIALFDALPPGNYYIMQTSSARFMEKIEEENYKKFSQNCGGKANIILLAWGRQTESFTTTSETIEQKLGSTPSIISFYIHEQQYYSEEMHQYNIDQIGRLE